MTRPFYFEAGATVVDWRAADTLVLPNPHWERSHAAEFDELARRLPALDAHVWVATSGTSSAEPGRMRWVALSKSAFLASARAVNSHLSATSGDVWAHALPVFHVGGLGILARAWLGGAEVVPAISGRWDPETFHAVVGRRRATLAALVPSQVHDLVAAGLTSPPSLRAIVVGGARLEPGLYGAARALGWPCLPSYGLTETCSQIATASLSSLSADDYPSVLPVLSHAEVRAGADGRLSVRGSSLLTCAAEWDGRTLRSEDPRRDGWFETEDSGRVSAAGVEVVGRAGDSVKVLGELVSLPRVEAEALRWIASEPALQGLEIDAAVVARPHARLGHELVLVLAGPGRGLAEPFTGPRLEAGLAAFTAQALLPFERIASIRWVDRIPRTPLGKCRRALLAREVGVEAGPDVGRD